MIYYILSILLGYFLGSFPTAYLLVKWKTHRDIRECGSGNVGARNAYDVTGSKVLAGFVLLIDLLKGIITIGFSRIWLGDEFWILAVGGLGSVAGHNYSLWIKFKGGRGLATAAGVMMMLSWLFVAVWCTLWGIVYFFTKHIHLSNVAATFISPLPILIIPEKFLSTMWMAHTDGKSILIFSVILCSLLLLRHTIPNIEM